MSGFYIVQGESDSGFRRLAPILAAQVAPAVASNNHYCVSNGLLMGFVTHDPLKNGTMPYYLTEYGMWGILEGRLFDSPRLREWRAAYQGHSTHPLTIFADLLAQDKLMEALPALNGAFVCILWNPDSGRLVCCNDRFGMYPMYWANANGRFCLATRALCSVITNAASGRWNPSGVAQMLTTSDMAGEGTMLEGVQTFPQASILTKTTDTLKWERYWHYDYTPRHRGESVDKIGADLGEAFIESVRRQCAGIERIGITLSGGLDSRCLVAAASVLGLPARTYTIGKPGCLDRLYASEISRILEMDHQDIEYEPELIAGKYEELGHIGEGAINFTDAHNLLLSRYLAGQVDIILNGFAGDLILGGSYLRSKWMREIERHELARRLFARRIKLFSEERLPEAMVNLEAIPPGGWPSEIYMSLLGSIEGCSTPDTIDRFFLENRVRRYTATGTIQLRQIVESTAPFFDYDLVDFQTGIPASLRKEHKVYIAMMRHALPETLKVRWQRTLIYPGAHPFFTVLAKAALKASRISEETFHYNGIVSRQYYSDFPSWFRGPLANWTRDVCLESHLVADEVLRPDFCARMWNEHAAGQDRATALGIIISFRAFSLALSRARRGEAITTCIPTELTAPCA